jgi:hypothetical protein
LSCLEIFGENISKYKSGENFLKEQERARKSVIVKVPDTIFFKKTYTASRICDDGETMRWSKVGFFKKRLEELGCMTDKEAEAYTRTVRQRERERSNQALQESIKDLQKTINPPTINCSSYGTRDGYNTTCTQY